MEKYNSIFNNCKLKKHYNYVTLRNNLIIKEVKCLSWKFKNWNILLYEIYVYCIITNHYLLKSQLFFSSEKYFLCINA